MTTDEIRGLLETFVAIPSPSGCEEIIADAFCDKISPYVDEVTIDNLNNVVALKRGSGATNIMVVAHADEVGFMVTNIDDRGFVSIRPVGGIDATIMSGLCLLIHGYKKTVLGIVGKRAVHLIKHDEQQSNITFDNLWVDIGCKSRDEAKQMIRIGDYVTYGSNFNVLRGDIVCSKSLDDKVGLAALVGLAQTLKDSVLHANLYFVASSQEELGARGARAVVNSINPDICIAIDVTHSSDYPSAPSTSDIKLGAGCVITIGPNINKPLASKLIEIADKSAIKYQIEPIPHPTGSDANPIQISSKGVITALLSIPCRYMHSPVEIASLNDVQSTVDVLTSCFKEFHSLG